MSVVSVVCQVEGSAMGWSLVQRGPAECGVFKWVWLRILDFRRPWPTSGCRAMKKKVRGCKVLRLPLHQPVRCCFLVNRLFPVVTEDVWCGCLYVIDMSRDSAFSTW